MYTLAYANSFKKAYKRSIKRGLPMQLLEEAINILVHQGELPIEYNPHRLKGRRNNQWECHLGGRKSDWLLVWEQDDKELILIMIDTGTHSDIFK